MEIILPIPQDRLSISLNDLLNRDFGMEQLDYRLCQNCNNSNTSEVTTSIHTHPDILIIMLQHECWNSNSERINTQVNFPSRFVPNQGLDNDEMPTEYNLFAAVCHKESRNWTQLRRAPQQHINLDAKMHSAQFLDLLVIGLLYQHIQY
jgi:ubiquitin C-terminal hydrolase